MTRTDSCQWVDGFDIMCGAEPDFIVVSGCVHEHLSENGMCRAHLDRLTAGKVRCIRCYDYDHCSKVLISARSVGVDA